MGKKDLDRPQKIKTSTEELEVLNRLKESIEWVIFKRLCMRYIGHIKSVSFNLIESDGHTLSVNHAGLRGEVRGIKRAIKIVEESGRKIEELEK